MKDGWQNNVKIPTVVTKEQFSFLGAITLGSATTFALGHGLLAKDNQVTFTFDHKVTAVGSTCVAGDVTVFNCSPDGNYAVKCTKQDVATTAACNLSLTFASDFARTITVNTVFTGLSNGVIFNPTFKLAAAAPTMAATLSETAFGQEMTISYTLPRKLTMFDTLMISEIDVADSRLEFVRFEPRTSATADSSIVEDGMRHVSLNLLDANTVSTTNFKVIMRHVPKLNYKGELVPKEVNTWIKDTKAVNTGIPVVKPTFPTGALRISAAPSAFTTLYSVLKIDHPDMVTGDSFTLNGGFVHTGGVAPELRCVGVPSVTFADDGTFTLTADVPANQPCFVVLLSGYALPDLWSITATTASGSVKVNVYAAGPAADTAVPTATSTSVLVKDVAATVKLTLPDFTTALAPADNMVFEFNYDTSKMTISQVTCADVTGTDNAGKVSVIFTKDTVPFESYGPATCTVGLTPLAAAAAPAFTNVLLFGNTLDNIALPVFQAALEPKLTVAFPAGPVAKDTTMSNVRYTFDQLTPAVGGTLAFTSKDVAGPLFSITLCSFATPSGDVITLTSTTTSSLCTFAPLYTSDAPISLTVTYTPPSSGTPVVFTVNAPASYQVGTVVAKVAETADTLTYRFTRTSTEVNPTSTIAFANLIVAPTTTFESDCAYASTSENLYIRYNIPAGVLRGSCDVRIVFKTGYNPDAQFNQMFMHFYPDTQYIYFPAVKGSMPTLAAGFNGFYTFTFSNADTATVQIENVWGVVATSANPIKVRPVADNTAVAGNAVTSADGLTLTVTFVSNYAGLVKENNKYSVDLCYLDFPALYMKTLQTTTLAAKFTVGSLSTIAYYDNSYISVRDAATGAVLEADSKYEVYVDMYLGGNQANFVIDYKNTALASVDKCFTSADFKTVDYASVTAVTTKGSSIAIALTESVTFALKGNAGFRVKCVFNTLSAAAIASKVGPFAKNIVIAVKGANNVDFFSVPVPVAIPFVAPKLAVAQIMSFTRATLFTSTELAALAKQYATGLRKTVAKLLDNQIIITGQKLIAATPAPAAVPSPIATQFALAADATVEVTFTSTPSTDAPVTTAEISTATPDIIAAFSSYTVTANTAEEALVDGECATRCGLGCALCAEGAACSVDADCIEGHCNISGVCGPEPTPDNDNAASSATISVAVLALIVSAVMF